MEKDTVGAWEDELVARFVADILTHTMYITNDTLHQQAVQAFVDALQPWMPPPINTHREQAPIFSHVEWDNDTGQIVVTMTPQGRRCFCGWLRRQSMAEGTEDTAQTQKREIVLH